MTEGSEPYALFSAIWVGLLVMNFTNFSAASLCLVLAKTAMLIPATMESTCLPPAGGLAGNGIGTTPYCEAFIPYLASEAPAACHISMAALPVAKSWTASVPLEYSASLGLAILSVPMKPMYCFSAATFCGVLKVGLPEASKKSPPCCWLSTNAWWAFSGVLAPSRLIPHWLPWVSFLPSATRSSQVAGGVVIPAAANIALL